MGLLIKALFGQSSADVMLICGALDQELLTAFLAAGEGRVLWLSPDGSDRLAADPGFAAATRANRLLFLTGEPAGTVPALGTQLSGRSVTAVLADRGGELSARPDLVRDLPSRIFGLTGTMPRIVMAVRRGTADGARLQSLLGALTEAHLQPAPDDGGSWLFAAAAAELAALQSQGQSQGQPAPQPTMTTAMDPAAKPFDLALVDEAEHLIPRPYGTLQTLNLDHLHRYAFAKSFCYNANVLDAAMGCGYSSLLLNCQHYTGVDIDHNMVAFANERYKPLIPNATYKQGSVLELPVESGSIDTFISFETIEHLQPGDIPTYFAEIRRVLRPQGRFLCSTPIYRGDNYGVLTQYHPFEFRYGHFETTLVNQGFDLRSLWYQWPPYYTVQSVVPSVEQTQQAGPVIAIAVTQLR